MTATTLVLVAMLLVGMISALAFLRLPVERVSPPPPPPETQPGADRDAVLESMRRHPAYQGRQVARERMRTPALRATARVLFASVQGGQLLLDCLVTDAGGPETQVRPGLPITLSLGTVDTPWLAVHITSMLERWAEGDRVVELELLDSAAGPRARLVSATSRVTLPLATVAGLDAD